MLTSITCPGCGERIYVEEDDCDMMVECGGRGEGTCDACSDLSNRDMVIACCAAQDAALAQYNAAMQPDPYCLASDAVERSDGSFPGIVAVPGFARVFVPVAPLLNVLNEPVCNSHWLTIRQIWNARPRVYVAPTTNA